MNYYESIPLGKENAISKFALAQLWNTSVREARRKVMLLRMEDNGDDFVIVSTSKSAGYYRSDNRDDIRSFKEEMSNRAKHTFRPIRKASRILGVDEQQYSFTNNLKMCRLEARLWGDTVVLELRKLDPRFDKSILSRIENGLCMPTPIQLQVLSRLYHKSIEELVGVTIISTEQAP